MLLIQKGKVFLIYLPKSCTFAAVSQHPTPKLMLKKHLYLLLALLVVAIWGETFVSSKVLLTAGLQPAQIFFIRFVLAYLCMLCLSHKRLWARSLTDELLFLLSGITGGSLYFLTENMALKYSTASNVAILVGTTPLVTAFLLALFYKEERMSRHQFLDSLIAFCGLVLVVLNGQLNLHLNPLGDTLALCAATTWGFYSLIMKRITRRYDSVFITRKVFAYGILSILPWFVLVEPLYANIHLLSQPTVLGNLLYLAFVASMGCFLLWNWVLPRIGIVRATNVVYTQCLFTMLISSLVLHERITPMAICGTAILILGMLLVARKG